MSEQQDFLALEAEIVKVLKEIYDPEIPVNVYDLGLIYNIDVDEENNVEITMTLTAPNCPIADSILREVETRVNSIEGVNQTNVNLVFDPPWDKDMMSEEAKLELGLI
jgi:FeS assembly SUF system protein